MAGPTRSGKTTFIKQDLIEELKRRQALVIYADLGKRKGNITPAQTVLTAVCSSLTSLASEIGLKRTSFTFDVERIGTDSGVSLADALLELISKIDLIQPAHAPIRVGLVGFSQH